jgi:hypothetical protein
MDTMGTFRRPSLLSALPAIDPTPASSQHSCYLQPHIQPLHPEPRTLPNDQHQLTPSPHQGGQVPPAPDPNPGEPQPAAAQPNSNPNPGLDTQQQPATEPKPKHKLGGRLSKNAEGPPEQKEDGSTCTGEGKTRAVGCFVNCFGRGLCNAKCDAGGRCVCGCEDGAGEGEVVCSRVVC